MAKLDLKKQYREFYNPSAKRPSIVDVPEMQFLMIDGAGDPNTSVAYAEAIEALYAMSYTLKFLSKATEDIDYVVMPLEGLWWTPDMAEFSAEDKSAWEWTAMIMQPGHITANHVATATDEVRRKKDPAALDRIRFESFTEG
ncbi:MAG: GyrI-like domain-containing protein, partial [Acidimicrobiia bacterium]